MYMRLLYVKHSTFMQR